MSRVYNVLTWALRLQRVTPLRSVAVEIVCFDMQAMVNPEISGAEYQQGTLAGYEIKEYLLEKWGRQCAYCKAKSIPLQVEHIIPRSRGGTKRVSILLWLAKIAIRARATLPQPNSGIRTSEAGITTSQRRYCSQCHSLCYRGCTQDFGITDIVLDRWQDKVQPHSAVLSESPLD